MTAAPPAPRYRNFDALRLFAASLVLFSHSFAMAQATEKGEPFFRIWGQGNIAGVFGVYMFFVISGFLITSSFFRRRSTIDYLTKRVLRIFPGLIACVIVVTFVVGPLVTTLPIREYLTDIDVYKFAVRTMLLFNTSAETLPGVTFDENNWFAVQPLGTVWTLRPEFICYLAVAALGLTKLLRPSVVLVLVGYGLWRHSHGSTALDFTFAFFAAGSFLYFVHERWRPTRPLVALAGVGMVAGAAAGYPVEAFAICGSLLVVQLATSSTVKLPRAGKHGDLSYGIYLYGWPVQELVNGALGNASTWWLVFAVSLPLSAAVAWCSWHLVEHRALAAAPQVTALMERLLRRKPSTADATA